MLAKGYGFIYDQLNRLTTSRYGEGTSYTSNVERYDENLTFKYILTPEGRATYSSGAYTYEYFMKDHLGNTRISFNVPGSTAVIVQQSDYYPYGMTHRPQAVTTSDNRYLFNGKELQNNLLGGVNLDWYDYGARFYDPQIGRWHVADPVTSEYPSISPYVYCVNDPINLIDPDGKDWILSEDGKTMIFRVALINSSYRKDIDLNKTKETITNQFNKAFGDGYKIEISVLDKNGKVSSDQHLIDIVSPATFGYKDGQEVLGSADEGGKYIKISSNYLSDEGSPAMIDQSVFAEEIGHSGGLSHPFEFGESAEFANGNRVPANLQSKGLDATTNNFMNYPEKAAGAMRDANGVTISREKQVSIIRDYYKNPSPATNGQKSQILENYRNNNLNYNDIPKKYK
ncbi:MAG: RHS repeat domain-containing protein [Bacteroidales bacterium]|jgi:RHS repeat-associated protein